MPTSPHHGKTQTVIGLVDPGDLGTTLMHEHLLLDVSPYFDPPEEASVRAWVDAPLTFDKLGYIAAHWHQNLDNTVILDERFAADQVSKFMLAGGRTVVDTTNIGLGRDPLALARISRRTGLNIVMGCGHYLHAVHPSGLDEEPLESIAERLIGEFEDGVG